MYNGVRYVKPKAAATPYAHPTTVGPRAKIFTVKSFLMRRIKKWNYYR